MNSNAPDPDASPVPAERAARIRNAEEASGAAAASRADLELSPFCVHLQSKKLFFADGPPQVIDDVLDASRHSWCRKTMQVLGPDGEIVDPRDCQSGRSCFQSIL
jgi:hypothetical protein